MPAQPTSKTDLAYAAIRAKILDGTYGPGYRLVIDSLARDLNVSAVPIREAIRRLEAEGWLVFTPNVGATVAELKAEQWVSGLEILAVLDGYATAMAAPELGRSDIEALREINGRMHQALADLDLFRFRELNREFHDFIIDRCPNPMLREEIQDLWDRLERMRRSLAHYITARAPESVQEHDELIDLLEVGASRQKIENAVRRHQFRTLESYLKNSAADRAAAVAATG